MNRTNDIFTPSTSNIGPKIVRLEDTPGGNIPRLLISKKKKKVKKRTPAAETLGIETATGEEIVKKSTFMDTHDIQSTSKSCTVQLPSVPTAPLTKKHIPKVRDNL